MQKFLAALFAQFLLRTFGSYKTTLVGVFAVLATSLGAFSPVVSPKYSPYVTSFGIFLGFVAAAMGHDSLGQASVSGGGKPASSFFSRMERLFSADQRTLGVIALILLAVIGTLPMTGCNGSEVAQDIVNFTPALQSAVVTVSSTASLLLPADALVFGVATAAFQAGSDLVVTEAKAYLANPTASVLQQLQQAVITLQGSVNSALLSAAKITNPTSQQHATAAIGGVATIVTAILALVEKVSTPAQLKAMAASSPVKLAEVRRYFPEDAVRQTASRFHVSPDAFFAQQTQAGF